MRVPGIITTHMQKRDESGREVERPREVHYRAGGRNATAQTTAIHRQQVAPRVTELALAKNALDLQATENASGCRSVVTFVP